MSSLEVFLFFSETNYCCGHISIRHTQKGSGLILLDEIRQYQKIEFPRRLSSWHGSFLNIIIGLFWLLSFIFFFFYPVRHCFKVESLDR